MGYNRTYEDWGGREGDTEQENRKTGGSTGSVQNPYACFPTAKTQRYNRAVNAVKQSDVY